MVLKTTLCRFSGLRIYPGKGVLFVRTDSQQYLFLSKKTRKMFINRKRPAKLAWTTLYRKQHKKDQVCGVACSQAQGPPRGRGERGLEHASEHFLRGGKL
jgi:large subunit ribosomal protein L24e